MKRSIFVFIAVLMLVAAPAFANCGNCGVDKKGHPKNAMKSDMADQHVKKLTKQLKLSDEQAKQAKALMDSKMEKKKAIHEETEKKMEAIHEEYTAGLKSILTPEQLEKYESLKEKKGDMRKHRKGSSDQI